MLPLLVARAGSALARSMGLTQRFELFGLTAFRPANFCGAGAGALDCVYP